MIQVLLFAGLSEAAGTSRVSLPDSGNHVTLREIQQTLKDLYPAVGDLLDHCMAAVNQEFADLDTHVLDGDEVAFIPPVSGG